MCQLIVFWHTCGHLLLSSMKCPFDGATTHDEETTTTSLVDHQCWLCMQSLDHPHWERIERLQSVILTVDQLEVILDISSYDADFLARIAGFYARGDHKRWGQPGEIKAKYTKQDSYITSLELEVALAARQGSKFPTSPGLVFDLEFALAKRFDVTNVSTLFWPLRGWRDPCPSFYSSANMLGLLSKEKMESCDVKLDSVPQFVPQFVARQASSKPSDSSGTPPSATTLSLCQNNNSWPTTFPSPLPAPTADFAPTFCDVVSDWMQVQDSDTSVSETQGPGPAIPSDNLFGFDPCPLNDAMMSGPEPNLPLPQMEALMATPTGIMMQQSPMDPYATIAANDPTVLYTAGNPAQAPLPSIQTSFPVELLPFGYTTPVLPSQSMSNVSTSMSPMLCQAHLEHHYQQQQQQQQHQQQQPITPTLFSYSTPNQFLSASIPGLPTLTPNYPLTHPQQQDPGTVKPSIKKRSPPKPKQLRPNPAGLFSSHGRPTDRYMTPVPTGPPIQIYETPDQASAQTHSTMDTDSSSPSPSVRRGRGKAVPVTREGSGQFIPSLGACGWGRAPVGSGSGMDMMMDMGIGMGNGNGNGSAGVYQSQDQGQGQAGPQFQLQCPPSGHAVVMTPVQKTRGSVPQTQTQSTSSKSKSSSSGSRKRKREHDHRKERT